MQKVLLLILDGWGHNPGSKANAIEAAKTPFYDSLLEQYPHTLLNASSVYVGLPDGIMGNSEVGHENIGAGRINKQKLTLISDMVRSGEFFENQELAAAFDHAAKHNSKIHFMGLISEGDVHSHLGHLDALIEFAKKKDLTPEQVYLHAISDGRDDPPYVAEALMKRYQDKVNIATVSGRYWAMDRDNNMDRVENYFDCVTKGEGLESASGAEAITDGYQLAKEGKNPTGDSDEFILPTLINKQGLISQNDAVIFFNFRPDRAKQISQRLAKDAGINNLHYLCFTDYGVDLPIAFTDKTLPKQDFSLNLGELVAKSGMNQFRIAETEKYNHVTTFFNSRRKEAYENEDRLLIPSPKVATYDLQPEMSLPELTDKLLEAMADKDKDYKLIVCNFANPDMVGHTGSWEAVTKALEAIDSSLVKVVSKAMAEGYALMLTADHGNADQMYQDDSDEVRTAHSTNPVPFVLINSHKQVKLRQAHSDPNDVYASLSLANIAPTICDYLGLEKPEQMQASSLLEPALV
ncbi:MAG: 2,3-bisphosphoglycerate-independent phosphoglycerate mutase [Candidatus Melainabacteria bacterium]|nr:2,3-bisphosphoglycerate-independent phosphoglycerate mutase [Candidatus Melainabacteria bacterium]